MSGDPISKPLPGLAGCEIRFDVSPTTGFILSLDENLAEQTLYLRHPQLEQPVRIAWDDSVHWHPHVLRWAELEAICRADASLLHPYLPLLLLYRFAPVTVGDDAPAIFATLEAAWRSLGLFDEGEIAEFSRRYDYRAAGFVWWFTTLQGWLIYQDEALRRAGGCMHDADLYSLRVAANPEFPFDAFDQMIAEAGGR